MFYKKIKASGDLSMPAGTRIFGVRLESVAANSTAILYDAITQALGVTNENEFCKLLVTAAATYEAHPKSDKQSFGPIGITLERGLSVTLSGTSARIFIYYA